MFILPDRQALLAARTLPLPAELHALLNNIVEHAAGGDLLDLSYLVVVEANDTAQAIAEEIGFDPLTNPIDNIRFDRPDFQPYWAHLDRRGDSYVLIHTVGDSGWALILVIDANANSELVRMCHRFTTVPL